MFIFVTILVKKGTEYIEHVAEVYKSHWIVELFILLATLLLNLLLQFTGHTNSA